jgi:predicted permease
MLSDFRQAVRSVRNTPGLTIAAIVTLALGIGANTAIFSVLQGVVLEPLPYHHPDHLVIVALFNRSLGYPTQLSYPDFLDWQRDSRSFDQIAAFANEGYDLTSPGVPEHIDGRAVSAGFFRTLGTQLAAGRAFSPEEDQVGGAPAAVISHRLWKERFDGSPEALGKPITLNGVDYTIVGVLTPDFRFGDRQADAYTPIARRNPLYIADRTVHDILCIARLRPQVSLARALAEMNTVQQHIAELHPAAERGQGAWLIPLKKYLVGDVGGTLLLLLGAVGLVLLIACANVANPLLARSAARSREFAIRLALGASRQQIVRQLVAESLTLSATGGAIGLAIARWGVRAVLAAAPGSVPRIENIGINVPVLLFALGLSMIVGVVFGLATALRSSRTDVQSGLREGGRNIAGGHQRTQQALIVLQVALALVLLTCGSLLLRTIQNLWAVNPGFDPQHVTTFQIGLSPAETNTPARLRTAYRQLTDRIRQIPGVEAADITALIPLGRGANEGPFWVGPHQPASMAEIPRAVYYPTGPDYIPTMKIPLLSGRLLTPADDLDSEVVVVIDTLLARRFFPAQNPLGRSITIPHWGAAQKVLARIVGIVGHVEQYGLDGSMGEKPQIYYAFYQLPDEVAPIFRSEIAVAVRSHLASAALMAALGNQPVYNVRTMQELLSGSIAKQRFPMLLLAAFAILALLLAFVGIYGVMSYWTIRRVNEIGIRMALGARRWDVVRMVVGHGLRLALSGVAIGAAAALALTKLLASFSRLLYGVRGTDPTILAAVAATLLIAAALACYVPARRAANLEPTEALRQE